MATAAAAESVDSVIYRCTDDDDGSRFDEALRCTRFNIFFTQGEYVSYASLPDNDDAPALGWLTQQ